MLTRSLSLILLLGTGCVATAPVQVSPVALRDVDRTIAQAHVREALRDPDGARFRHDTGYAAAQGDRIVCGEFNATNGFGGYAGYQTYYVRLRGGYVDAAHLGGTLAQIGCNAARDGSVNLPAPRGDR